MTKEGRIVFCHCAYADVVPEAVKEQVLQRLAASGVAFEAVTDLCEMAARRDPVLQQWAASDNLRIVACYPRAVKWLFAAADADLAAAKVQVFNMRTDSPEGITAALLGTKSGNNEADGVAAPRHIPEPGQWKPWFPVIDRSRCTNCMQCLSFCLFDVYGVSPEGRIQVQRPSNCKTDCPACSRVCPEVAILFPKYKTGPINGAEIKPEDVRREAMKVDVSALLGGDIYAALRNRNVRAKSRFSKERDEQTALGERQQCLARLQEQMDVPPEVLAALPSAEEIRTRAEQAKAKAQEALRASEQSGIAPRGKA